MEFRFRECVVWGGAGAYSTWLMRFLGQIGAGVLGRLGRAARTTAVVWAVATQSVRPGTWTAPMRNVLARQVLFTGLEATGFVAMIALIVGTLVVVQAQFWLMRLGQAALIGPILTGVDKPIQICSTNSTVNDILNMAAIAAGRLGQIK